MDSAIPISAINDFLFCPKSLYLHSVYSSFDTSIYHDTPQVQGNISHETIDKGQYSTSKDILQGMSIYSAGLGIKGKIDVYDIKHKHLIERKYKIKNIYKGYRYQLYAQMYCLKEMGLSVKKLFLHSLSDNKRYEVPLPTISEKKDLEAILSQMRVFNPELVYNHVCPRCNNNIYGLLNW